MSNIWFISCLAVFLCSNPVWSEDEKFPSELVRFKLTQNQPIFAAAGPMKWDAVIRERGWIMREGDLWKMWYTGYEGKRDSTLYLGYATSKDGIDWKRYDKNPLYSRPLGRGHDDRQGRWKVLDVRRRKSGSRPAAGFR